MEGYLVELEDSLMNFRDVEHRGVVKKEQEIIELFYFKFMDIPRFPEWMQWRSISLMRWKR